MTAQQLDQIRTDIREELRAEVVAEVKEEWRALFQATAKGPASAPPPYARPPLDLDTFDVRQIEHLKSDILRETKEEIRRATSDFVPDEEINDRISDRFSLAIEKMKGELILAFKTTNDEAVDKLRTEIFDIFDDLRMPLEKGDRRRETREKLEGLFDMHASSKAFWREFLRQLRGSIITWLLGGLSLIAGVFFFRGGGAPPK